MRGKTLHDIMKELKMQQSSDEDDGAFEPKPTYFQKLFKKVRKLWCYKHEEWTDCSFDTPGAVWFGGNDTYEVKIVYAIPFWIRDEDDVVNYTDKYCDQDWLYW